METSVITIILAVLLGVGVIWQRFHIQELEREITDQQRQIDDLKRELEEMKNVKNT